VSKIRLSYLKDYLNGKYCEILLAVTRESSLAPKHKMQNINVILCPRILSLRFM